MTALPHTPSLTSISTPRRRWRGVITEATWALAGWLLLWPVTWVLRRRPELVVFYGRDGGKYLDNCKYLSARAAVRSDLEIKPIFIARDRDLRDALRAQGLGAELASSAKATLLWLRAGTIVVDNVDWLTGMRYPATRGARIVQLWHGIPLKQVQMGRVRARSHQQPWWERSIFQLYLRIVGRKARLDWMLSTAPLVTERAFSGSFIYKRISHAGYPRNDALFEPPTALTAIGIDHRARERISQHRATTSGGKIGLYAPTFREGLTDPFADGSIDLKALSDLALRLNLLLLVKLHPWMHGRLKSTEAAGIVLVSPDSDVYPLLREVDFLITDYSSIYFDYLLLDRPVVFFPYDLDRYLAEERRMYFDYDQMTPGPKPRQIAGLLAEIEAVATDRDDWKAQRAAVRSMVFQHADGHAADRLLEELFPKDR